MLGQLPLQLQLIRLRVHDKSADNVDELVAGHGQLSSHLHFLAHHSQLEVVCLHGGRELYLSQLHEVFLLLLNAMQSFFVDPVHDGDRLHTLVDDLGWFTG